MAISSIPRGGRPKGSPSTLLSLKARKEAEEQGLLPHQWLLKVARGDPIVQHKWKDVLDKRGQIIGKELLVEDIYPDLNMRQDAAKAAAPYYAPRLATQVIKIQNPEGNLNHMTDDQLDQEILKLAGLVKPRAKKNGKVSGE
jgi:hypothetical protein